MSLVGNLHDLGLGEILQIVSLSRKSGILTLSGKNRKAEVVFRKGEVLRACSSAVPARLGEALLRKGVVDLETLQRGLGIQSSEGFRRLLGFILVELGVPVAAIEEVVREQIENTVFQLFEWEEGSFEFEIGDHPGVPDDVRLDPLQFMLDQGLNPQYLAMEGTRLLDEKRHRGEFEQALAAEEDLDIAFDLVEPEPEPQKAAHAGHPVVVVDDDPETLRELDRLLTQAGYTVRCAAGGEEALIAVDSLCSGGASPSLVVDLSMPRMDRTGASGGLELLELIKSNFPDLPLVALSEAPDSSAEAAGRLGAAVAEKPARESLRFFGGELERALCRARETAQRGRLNLGDELRLEFSEEVRPAPEPSPQEADPAGELPRMLEELQHLSGGGGVILLALRFAAQFLNRGVVLLVKREVIKGLGEFGVEDSKAASRVRGLEIPAQAPSVLRDVIDSRAPYKGALRQNRWNDHLVAELGGAMPVDCFVAPIVSGNKVVALLYGDNLPEHRPIGDTRPLEVFLSQAGIAMEKGLLKRKA